MSKKRSRATSDPIITRYLDRVNKRDERHGNWRQVFVDCLGMCQYPVSEDYPCGEVEGLEFHEQFGEAKAGEAKFQLRVLLCNYHHWSIHGEKWVNKRHYPSMLQADIDAEMWLAGGLRSWMEHYNLKERRFEYDFTTDSQADKTDLDNSENTESDRGEL